MRIDSSSIRQRTRRRARSSVAVLVAALCAATAQLPTSARVAAENDDAGPPGDERVPAASTEAEVLQEAFGLKGAELDLAVRLQGEAAVVRDWASASVPGYSGTWLEYDPPRVVIGATSAATYTPPPEFEALFRDTPVEFRPTAHSWDELHALAVQLKEAAARRGVWVDAELDGRGDSVLLLGSFGESAEMESATETVIEKAAARLVPEIDFTDPRIRVEHAELAPPATVGGGWAGSSCSMGFAVVSPAGQRAVTTAGHCGSNQGSHNGVPLGTQNHERTFWVNRTVTTNNPGWDRQLHPVPSPHLTVGRLEIPDEIIRGTILPALNTIICRYGRITATQGYPTAYCDFAQSYNAEGLVVMRTNCPPGDSGGPAWQLGRAIGMAAITTTHATDPALTQTGRCWFAPAKDQLSPLNYFLQEMGSTTSAGNDLRTIGLFTALTAPKRVYDSGGPLHAHYVDLYSNQISDRNIGALAATVTIIPSGTAGFVRVAPGDGLSPAGSTQNFGPSGIENAFIVAKTGDPSNRQIRIVSTTPVRILIDAVGYFADGSGTETLTSLDGRAIPVQPQRALPLTTVSAGSPITVTIAGSFGVPAAAKAAIVNVTTLNGTAPGYLQVYRDGASPPPTSTSNWVNGEPKAKLEIVRLGSNGKIKLNVAPSGSVGVIIDVLGYIGDPNDTLRYGRTLPADGTGGRLLDSRSSGGRVQQGQERCVNVYANRDGTGNGLPRERLLGVWLNVAAVDAQNAGYLKVYGAGSSSGTWSNVNFSNGTTRANLAFVKVPSASNGSVCVGVGAPGAASTHILIDVVAYTYS